ncbi:MAG: hypothetical protein U0V74_06095 [Chitinophagales bacterium]
MEEYGSRTSYDAVITIQAEFPALAYQLQSNVWIKQLFISVQNLAAYTKEQLLSGNQKEVEHCYNVAREILDKGGNISRMAIENVFVYAVSHLLEVSLSVSQEARSLFLALFKKEYCRQLNATQA